MIVRVAPTVSVLVAARKNSKYLAKFLTGLIQNTDAPEALQVLVMLNADDLWNRELADFLEDDPRFNIKFFREDYRLGRAGLHAYFNDLYKRSWGDWVVYFCEDHYIPPPSRHGWDSELTRIVGDLDPGDPWVLVPKFDNVGAMNHVLSRGFIEAMGGYLGRHGNIDSYINDVLAQLPKGRAIRVDEPWFHDFTHDKPSPMSDAMLQSRVSPEGKELERTLRANYQTNVDKDADRIKKALEALE